MDDSNRRMCGAKKKQCRRCAHRFPKAEYDLDACPECGEDRRCRNRVAVGRTRCRFHGGYSPRGKASPSWQTGRYSKHLPDRLLQRFEESLFDPRQLELRDEIALLDGRIIDVLSRVDTGESGRLWKALKTAWGKFLQSQRSKDADEMAAALETIGSMIRAGNADYAAWAEIRSMLDQRRRLTESERKRRIENEQMLAISEAVSLFARIGEIIKAHVDSVEILDAISTDLNALMLAEPSGEFAGGA